ncbi:MAG: sugar transferase [Candidatus Zixiibacteriota bacterium]|nr:MAG: sugar transferase [candidate division Zixibacteria bacterium]
MDASQDSRKRSFEIPVLPVKAGRGPADITSKESGPDETYRVPWSNQEQTWRERSSTSSTRFAEAPAGVLIGGRRDGESRVAGLVLRIWGKLFQTISRPVRRVLLASAGQIGTAVFSLAALWVAMSVNHYSGGWTLQATAGLLIIRVFYYLTRGPAPVLMKYRIRKRIWWVFADELQMSVAFLAACFLMSWPISLQGVLTFVNINLLVQIALLPYARWIVRILSAEVYELDAGSFARRAVILGTGKHAQRVADMVLESPDMDTKLVGFLDYRRDGMWRYRDAPLLGHPHRLEAIIAGSQVDAVFVAVDPEDMTRSRSLFDTAERMGVPVFVMPNVYYPTVSRIRPSFVNGMPALVYRSEPENRPALFVKSVIDRLGALISLVLVSPIMAVAALCIKLESKGPLIFRQTRTGVNGRTFQLLKFRTMCVDAESKKAELTEHNEMSGPVFKIRRDPRITRVGQFLRKYSIDELPQLVNVLKGEMSLVGPRPPLPKEVTSYMPWQHRRLSVKPGVTCLWQVNGRNEIGFEDWMRLDLEYIDNWSLWLDAKIIAKTVPAVLKGTGV